ncbi:MAG: ABC transporter ATP-binding protein [Clostridia bacterium]
MEKKAKKKVNWGLLNRMLKGNYRYVVLATAGLLLAVISAYIVPLITSFTVDFVIGGKDVVLAPFIESMVNMIGGRDYLVNNIYLCALLLLFVSLINALAVFLRGRSISVASEGFAKNMRDSLYHHLQSVPYDYHKHVSTGDLIQRCTSDVETVRRFLSSQLLEIVRTFIMAVVACAIMFNLHAPMALVSISLLPVICLSSFLYFKMVRKQFTKADEAEGKLSATLQENLTGMRVVRAFSQQQNEVEKFTDCNSSYRRENMKLMKMLGFYWGFSDMLGYMQILITLGYGIVLTVTTDFTLGQLLIFTTYSSMLTWPVRQLGRVLADLGKATVSMGRLDEILSADLEKEPGKALTPPIEGNIEFKNVCFGYDKYNDVLDNISFKAKKGQTIAILGSTGSGKTSLVQLLQRLYTVTGGEILINGVNINDIERGHLRRNIGIVLQEPFLYSRTIMENIKITNPAASNKDVFEAARVACVHDVIVSFEQGYDTIVGEKGVTLSGGQKQRVAIARMLMQNAPILIFDDSLSAVDTETDTAIRAALRSRRENTMTFIISHRITTLCEADNILVLEHGKLVEEGTHEELIHREGLYKRIAQIQNLLETELNEGGDDK